MAQERLFLEIRPKPWVKTAQIGAGCNMTNNHKMAYSSSIVLSAADGFLGDIVPDFGQLLEDQLQRSGSLGSSHSERVYL
jgi:hypothetical protein